MSKRTLSIIGAAAAAWAVLAAPTAIAAPAADAQGYVDSTARCSPPAEVVVFGSTATSRVAICELADGSYEYRGVRLRDGAKLIVPATRIGGQFSAENAGITFFVSQDSLVVSAGTRVIREEKMVDFHDARSSDGAPSEAPAETATPTTPLPPPLPAEVGGS
ncbi:MAG TPA: hypothetical protein VHH12_07425 [Mycobacterium sp.]|nr:hypothetical protein [Mycobacterium sp.]